jgi:hypothetical protein
MGIDQRGGPRPTRAQRGIVLLIMEVRERVFLGHRIGIR